MLLMPLLTFVIFFLQEEEQQVEGDVEDL